MRLKLVTRVELDMIPGITLNKFIDTTRLGTIDGGALYSDLSKLSFVTDVQCISNGVTCKLDPSSTKSIRDLNSSLQNTSKIGMLFIAESSVDNIVISRVLNKNTPQVTSATREFFNEFNKLDLSQLNSVLDEITSNNYNQLASLSKIETTKDTLYDNPTDLILSLLQNEKGIFLGDNHQSKSIDFITKNLEVLKNEGVTTLFLECFRSKDQNIIDSFFSNGSCAQEIMQDLQLGWSGYDSELPKAYFDLTSKAKNLGIKIKAIDTNINEKMGFRCLIQSNNDWLSTIKNNLDQQKYVVIGGTGHALSDSKISGIPKSMNIPSVGFTELNNTSAGIYKTSSNDPAVSSCDYVIIL